MARGDFDPSAVRPYERRLLPVRSPPPPGLPSAHSALVALTSLLTLRTRLAQRQASTFFSGCQVRQPLRAPPRILRLMVAASLTSIPHGRKVPASTSTSSSMRARAARARLPTALKRIGCSKTSRPLHICLASTAVQLRSSTTFCDMSGSTPYYRGTFYREDNNCTGVSNQFNHIANGSCIDWGDGSSSVHLRGRRTWDDNPGGRYWWLVRHRSNPISAKRRDSAILA